MTSPKSATKAVLENAAWQGIPGCRSAEIYPLLRKPDASCSNAFIVRTPAYLLVVDPGADAVQTAAILQVLRAQLAEKNRRVLVLLTHCHRDHAWACSTLGEQLDQATIHFLAQESGARALRERDPELTVAYLYKEAVPETAPFVSLLTQEDRDAGCARELVFAGGNLDPLVMHAACISASGEGNELAGQCLSADGADPLHVFHAPGHSPDSIALALGRLLFLGDLTLSANPGIAGICGWDRADLARSLAATASLVRERDIEICCPGHGNPLPTAKALAVLDNALGQTRALRDLARLDAQRVRYLKEYAASALAEASELLTVVGARIFALAHRLEQLGEAGEAQRILESLDAAAMDSYLTEFQQYAAAFGDAPLDMVLPLKGLQIFGRIEAALSGADLDGVVGVSLIRRARRLMAEFINTTQGLPAAAFSEPEDVNLVLAQALASVRPEKSLDKAMMASLEDPLAFARALSARMAAHSVLRNVELRLEAQIGIPQARISRDLLGDAVIMLLERMAAGGGRAFRVETGQDAANGKVRVRIAADRAMDFDECIPGHTLLLLRSSLEPFGASLRLDASAGAIMLEMPQARFG